MSYFKSLFSLNNKISIVTGASRGNGKSIAEALLRAGSTVILIDISKKELSKTVKEFQNENLKAFEFFCDITKKKERSELLKYIKKDFGKLDILVNNAGIVKRGLEYRIENFGDVINTNLMGIMRMSHESLPKLALSHGNIINIASMWSFFGSPVSPGYTASKTGVIGLTKSLANGWSKHHVRVNCIAPGWIETKLNKELREDKEQYNKIKDRTPMERWGNPKEIAGAAVYLASNKASFTTGATIVVDGGYSIA